MTGITFLDDSFTRYLHYSIPIYLLTIPHDIARANPGSGWPVTAI